MARVIKYENYNELAKNGLTCEHCSYTGKEGDFCKEYYESILFDVTCPECDKMMYVIPYDIDYEKYNT